MTTLTRIRPVREMDQLHRFFDQISESLWTNATSDDTPGFPVDVRELESRYVVEAAVPGIARDQLSVEIQDGVLTISGETTAREVHQDEKVYRQEIRRGKFARSLRLPEGIDESGIQARLDHGILTITLHKAEPVKPKRVEITVNAEG